MLLNNMRVMGVFDWILAVKDYIVAPVDDPWKDSEFDCSRVHDLFINFVNRNR